MRASRIADWTMCALMAAVTGVLAQLIIPIGPVPINMATLAVLIAGGLLGAKYGAVSLTVYLLLGAVGVPVFAGMGAGFGILTGPTGGYIVGYIVMAWITGFSAERWGRRGLPLAAGMAAGTLALYTLGTAWFMFSRGMGLFASLMSCVFPFLPMDAVKIAAAAALVARVHRLLPARVGAGN